MPGKIFITCENIIFGSTEKQWKWLKKFQMHFLPFIEHTSASFSWFYILNIPYSKPIYIQSCKCWCLFSSKFSVFKILKSQVREKTYFSSSWESSVTAGMQVAGKTATAMQGKQLFEFFSCLFSLSSWKETTIALMKIFSQYLKLLSCYILTFHTFLF